MTDFAKHCELEALVTEREKMRTHNDYCNAVQSCKDGPFHEQSEFDDLAARMRALAEEHVKRSLSDVAYCAAVHEIDAILCDRKRSNEDMLQEIQERVVRALSVSD
jgi:hypothetical protein